MIKKLHIFQYSTLVVNGRYPAKGAAETLAALHSAGIPFLILTEQSGKTRREIVEHMMKMGFYHMAPDTVYTSTMAAADWIARQYPNKVKACYIGGRGLREVLDDAGFEIVNDGPDWLFNGFDRNAGYTDYTYCLSLIRGGAALISTDSSAMKSSEAGEGVGPGAICRMLEYASGVRALEFGRPSVITTASVLRYAGVRAEDVVFVGDDFRKDIVPAIRCRMDTVYVTNGSSYELNMADDLHPKWIIEDLTGLIR